MAEYDLNELEFAIVELSDDVVLDSLRDYLEATYNEQELLTWDEVEQELSDMHPVDVFILGQNSSGVYDDRDWYRMDGYDTLAYTSIRECIENNSTYFAEYVADNDLFDELGLNAEDFIE